MTTAIHVTHEAVKKFGGIGSVLRGLISSAKYHKAFRQTLLYTPLFHFEEDPANRLGENSELLYSGLDNLDTADWGLSFSKIEQKYCIHIVYGKKKFYPGEQSSDFLTTDIVAVNIWNIPDPIVNDFKYKLWESYGIQSDKFAHDRDYEQYLRIAIVLRDIYNALYGEDERAVLFSHEYMGMPSALAFQLDKRDGGYGDGVTVFYAHEVSTARILVENHPGHDMAFYNVLDIDKGSGTSLEEEFGSFSHYSRNELVKCASNLDLIFAVSHITKDELLYLCPRMDAGKIKVVYNGISMESIAFEDKMRSAELIKGYCRALYNYRPDYIFTHITRLITSKAIWRDIRFLYHLDEHFSKLNIKGFFIILSTLVGGGRSPESVKKMEKEYGWPVVHREGWPDIIGPEIDLYRYLEIFNSRSVSIKGVFLNQFGFGRDLCGDRVPSDATTLDLRLASDIEFGLSIYEPFGIAQIENLPYGGMPVLSSACGCLMAIREHARKGDYFPVDFIKVPKGPAENLKTKHDYKNISREFRDYVEMNICAETSHDLIKFIPKNDRERRSRLASLQKTSRHLGWDHVADRVVDYVLQITTPCAT